MPHANRLFVLGAGFSCAAGLPLAVPLWKEIRETANNYSKELRAYKFNNDLLNYIAFRKDALGEELTPETVNFEDFIRYLDIEHYLGLRGGDTWSTEGNEGTIVTKYLIGRILARHLNNLGSIPDLYLDFAKRLDLHDTIITFNYDTLLEQALEAVGKPYRLFPYRYEKVGEFGGIVDSSRDEVVVLKMHGSIDWFDRTHFNRIIQQRASMGAPPPGDIIFSNEKELDLVPLTEGPRPVDDPLRNIYRARNLRALYAKDFLFLATPRMLPPSNAKLLYSNGMHDFWSGMNDAGYYSYGMSIIGFSLPEQDDYLRQILYTLVTNYQCRNAIRDHLGCLKAPLTIVDYCRDVDAEKRFRERFRFVDWTKTKLFGNGFHSDSLDSMFALDFAEPPANS
jgi:hypothetical protein